MIVNKNRDITDILDELKSKRVYINDIVEFIDND